MTLHAGKFEEILLLEDNARGLERRPALRRRQGGHEPAPSRCASIGSTGR